MINCKIYKKENFTIEDFLRETKKCSNDAKILFSYLTEEKTLELLKNGDIDSLRKSYSIDIDYGSNSVDLYFKDSYECITLGQLLSHLEDDVSLNYNMVNATKHCLLNISDIIYTTEYIIFL